MTLVTRLDESHDRWLVVEGKNDGHAVRALMGQRGAAWGLPDPNLPFVKIAGDVDRALDRARLGAAWKMPLSRLGIVIDANGDIGARWAQAVSAAASLGVHLPAAPAAEGTIVDDPVGERRLGIWVMPDNELQGKLESFLARLVPDHDPVWDVAVDATRQALAAGADLRPVDREKGELHAWLAWQDPPGMPFGTAITARVLEPGCPAAEPFVAWFKRLYDLND